MNLFVVVVFLLALEKQDTLYGKEQKSMPTKMFDNNSLNFDQFIRYQIGNNKTVIDEINKWTVLHFKEAYMIKKHKPFLNLWSKGIQTIAAVSKSI